MTITLALLFVLLAVGVGGGLGAYRAFQDPRFYALLVDLLWDRLAPELLKLVANDFTPEHAEKVAESARTGQPIKGSRHGPRHPGEH